MEAIKQLLNFGWVGSLISLIGLIAAVIIYRASLIGARPVFQLWTLQLLSKESQALPPEVSIFYKGSSITRVTRTQIVFWNSGKSLLQGNDVVKEDPLRFVFEASGLILNAAVVKMTRPTNKFTVNLHPERSNELVCGFDYLDPGDGATIEVLHTAENGFPNCHGTIRGVPSGVQDWGWIGPRSYLMNRFARMLWFYDLIPLLLGASFLCIAIYVDQWLARVPFTLFGLLFLILGLSDWLKGRRAPPALRSEEMCTYRNN
jgi:hypothetical protein